MNGDRTKLGVLIVLAVVLGRPFATPSARADWIDELIAQGDGVSITVYQSEQVTNDDCSATLIQVAPGETTGDTSATVEQILSILEDALRSFVSGSSLEIQLAAAIESWCAPPETPVTENSQSGESYLPGSWPIAW